LDLDTYRTSDATTLSAALTSGELSVPEVRALAGEMHRLTDAALNGVAEWYADDRLLPPGPSPFAGLPMLRKDFGSSEAGELTEMGSRLAAGYRSTSTGLLVQRWRDAGLDIRGRTAVPEFIQHGVTESRAQGVTRNPWNSAFSPGGSSGGAGAVVAAGVVPIAHASDCAGSIRIPAAVCGLVGLLPTAGLTPWAGEARGQGWWGIAREFVLTRTVRDAQRMLEVSAGVPRAAPTAAALRVGISTAHWAGGETEPDVVAAVHDTAQALTDMGHDLVPVEAPVDPELLGELFLPLFGAGVAEEVAAVERETGRRGDPSTLEPVTLAMLDAVRALGPRVGHNEWVGEKREEVLRQLANAHRSFDVLLTPTIARSMLPIGHLGGEVEDFDTYLERNDEFFPYSYLANVAGVPALSVPSVPTADGHPVGVQLQGRPGDDWLLLDLAAGLEAHRPWAHRRPVVTPEG
jgi:amidase